MDWIECGDCGAEFKVISDFEESIEYCPYCGSIVEEPDDDRDEDEEEYD